MFGVSVQQLKKKMKQLRDQFSRENKMFEDHSSKWQFYEEMRFLNQDEEQRCVTLIEKEFAAENQIKVRSVPAYISGHRVRVLHAFWLIL